MIGPHENTVDRAWLNTQRTEHALGVVNGEAVQPKSFADRTFFLVDVDAVHRTRLSTLFAADTCRQIESMETSITRLHFDRHFGIGVRVSKRLTLVLVRLEHRDQGDVHAVGNSAYGEPDIAKPHEHDVYFSKAR